MLLKRLIMLYKPLFIIHVTVKALFKGYVQEQSISVTKVGMAHAHQWLEF